MLHCGLILLAASLSLFPSARAAVADTGMQPGLVDHGPYDQNPNHLWNRLHRVLFVRMGTDGVEYGLDQLDPLLWFRTQHLLVGPSHTNAVAILDEFLTAHGEALIRDPLKRALLQRDLWALFDWTVRPDRDAPQKRAREALQLRLSAAILRLALTRDEINALPDSYLAASQFQADTKAAPNPGSTGPHLPGALFATNGSWVCLGVPGEQPFAPAHVYRFDGRSAFLVFMQTPGGRQETTNYLKRFREFPQPYLYEPGTFDTNRTVAVPNPNLPVFPDGTTFALVRQMVLLDQTGSLVPTHLTESVQIRRYNDTHPVRGAYGMAPTAAQTLSEFVLSRERLFKGIAGGLRAVAPDEQNFLQFMSKGFDPFEEAVSRHEPLSLHPALDCMTCHGQGGLASVASLMQNFASLTATLPYVTEVTVDQQRDTARYWKQQQFSWGLLQGLWAQR
jgi:hypothetical protein